MNFFWFVGNVDYVDKLFMKRDGKINVGLYVFKLIGGSGINFYNMVFF